MEQKTALFDCHLQSQAKMVDFGGWQMPLHYGSQMKEHHAVRDNVGMFDVSHMTVVDIKGPQANAYARYLLANDVDKLKTKGKALYSCMLDQQGGIIDDLICYYLDDEYYRMIVNAATREKDLNWMKQQAASFDVVLTLRDDLSMIAVQGPNAHRYIPDVNDLKPFYSKQQDNLFIARTGYTGEDGLELLLPHKEAIEFWQHLLNKNVQPCGLGARDTLRLEAGLNLYGQDMDESVTPYESNLSWTVSLDDAHRHFIGREALAQQKKEGIPHQLVGLVLVGKGVLRSHQKVITDQGVGTTTSGTYSPTLEKSIAFASVPGYTDLNCQVEIRNRLLNAKIVKLPFVKEGKPTFKD